MMKNGIFPLKFLCNFLEDVYLVGVLLEPVVKRMVVLLPLLHLHLLTPLPTSHTGKVPAGDFHTSD